MQSYAHPSDSEVSQSNPSNVTTVVMTAGSMMNILERADSQHSAWCFDGPRALVKKQIRMVLNIDGIDTPHAIHLNPDGTWIASTDFAHQA